MQEDKKDKKENKGKMDKKENKGKMDKKENKETMVRKVIKVILDPFLLLQDIKNLCIILIQKKDHLLLSFWVIILLTALTKILQEQMLSQVFIWMI